MWRLLKGKIPINDNLKRYRIPVVSKCCYCQMGCEETVNHLFLTSPTTQNLWKYFLLCVGFRMEGD